MSTSTLAPAKFVPFTIPAFSATGIYGAEIKLDTILEVILAISPIPPFSHEKISGSYFDGNVPSSDLSRTLLASANMRNVLADHMKGYWSPYGIFHLVSTHNDLLTHKGDNIFPGNLCGIRTAFVVHPQEGGWLIFIASLDLPVALTPKYRLILPYNPVAES